MINKYNFKNMVNRFLGNNNNLRAVFILFLGLMLSFSSKSQNCQLLDSLVIEDVDCFGGNSGSINLSVSNSAVSYFWNTLSTADSISDVPVGTYNVIITDLLDPACYLDTSFTVSGPQDPLYTAITLQVPILCAGDSTAKAKAIDAIGGTGPYSYIWDNGQNTQVAEDLWEGTHVVTVTDANLCQLQVSIDIISDNPPISADYINIFNQVSCFGACDAIVEFAAVGGVPGYDYTWDIGQTFTGTGPDTAFGLCFGGHNILVEDDIGCRKTFTYLITQPNELLASAIMHEPVQCYGFDNGMALANGAQGTTPYIFYWDADSLLGMDTVSNQISGNLIDSLTPGIHTVYIQDANGCMASDTVMITEPTLLEVNIIDSLTIFAYCSNTNSGELCAVASGGTPNYSYIWNDDDGQNTTCASNLISRSALYTITVTDERMCVADASFDLDSITNSMSIDSVVLIESSVSCFGLYDGELTVNSVSGGLGGVSPYTYNWDGPGSYTGTGNNISSLYQGNYSVLISDDNGCEITTGIYLNQPDILEYDIYNSVDETCLGAENGQIWVHVNGGTSPYYYDQSELGVFPIPNSSQIEFLNDSLLFNFSPGMHSIYVVDTNGCEGAVTFGAGLGGWTVNIGTSLIVPQPLLSSSSTSCFNTNDGSAFVLDPDPLFTYSWEEQDPLAGGAPTGLDISNGAGSSWGAFSPGTYWLVAHYADSASFGIPYSGCDNSTVFTIGAGTSAIIVSDNITNLSCFGDNDGKISLSISGGNGPYNLVWDTVSTILTVPDTIQTLATFDLLDLSVGTYSVTVIDASGCLITESYPIDQPLPLISNIEPTHVRCNGESNGSAELEIASGAGGYLFTWEDGQTTQTATNLSAGEIWVIVKDGSGCTYSDTILILEPESPIALVEADSLYYGEYDVRCFGEDNASAFVTGSGIEFSWEDENGVEVSDEQNTGAILSAGVYTVTVEDINECEATAEITITQPDLLNVSVIESNPSMDYQISCYNFDDGTAEVETNNGGVPINNVFGYNVIWEDEDGYSWGNQNVADNLEAGHSYTAFVTDANGCEAEETTDEYTQPDEFIANVSTLNYPGPSHAPVNISFIDSTESDEPYSFDWYWNYSVGDDEPDYEKGDVEETDNKIFVNNFDLYNDEDTDNFLNSYSVLAALENDETGCVDTVRFIIEVQGLPSEIPDVFTPNGDGKNDFFYFSEFEMKSVDVQIYNRWGQLVYAWKGSDKSWNGVGIDGKALAEGVYFYSFVSEGVDGYYYDKKGTVTLLR
jgi:gliding motility-associated-like protein